MHNALDRFRVVRSNHHKSVPAGSPSFWRPVGSTLAVLLLSTLAVCFVMAGPANSTDKPWVSKDWTTWTRDDCIRVERVSPWSYYNSFAEGRNGKNITLVQLWSALPVRQARLRDIQLQKHYDKMDSQEKQNFDRLYASNFASEVGDKVEVIVTNTSDQPPPHASAESGTFAPDQAVQAALKLADGSIVQPIQTIVLAPPAGVDVFGNKTEYDFPRTIGDKPLYSSSDPVLAILLGAPLIVDKKTKKVEMQDFHGSGPAFSFKISDLMYKGKPEY